MARLPGLPRPSVHAIDPEETAMTTTSAPTFTGTLLTPGSPGYDDARRVWNGAIDRHPALIARCRSSADVAAALELARRHDLAVAVRGGGHSIPGWSVCDGGLVIDLTEMKGIRIDPGPAPPSSSRASPGASSTRPRSSTAWPPRAGRSRTPASPG